ncbi:hypothetical protein ACTJKK_13570 [Microbacterium sp. 22179]|jgi:hypothetical protein|uniref:hypothetical protein n=1 Tax=Microbacterium sp. 22179 TaxID=3453886 RepID=UPI003F831716
MSNPPPIPPIPSLGNESDDDRDGVPTLEVDGAEEVDPDIDGTQVDSAEADRIAAEGE